MLPYVAITAVLALVVGLWFAKESGTTTISGLRIALYLWSGVAGLVLGAFVAIFAAVAGLGAISFALLPTGFAVGFASAFLGNAYRG